LHLALAFGGFAITQNPDVASLQHAGEAAAP
jgi:hypothetical protein